MNLSWFFFEIDAQRLEVAKKGAENNNLQLDLNNYVISKYENLIEKIKVILIFQLL